ncbi:hypothetical protein [Sphingomonas sp.]|uniref:hypothetical protein n=1 Tax=Sphingomonas sp. TaxID=28214 RepID=UPI002DD6AFAC|nr:hypothetical protein [Sphingomonas sp.]
MTAPLRDSDPRFDVGATIPPRRVPLSLQRLVMEAGVNRDFAPIHHDMDVARTGGAPGAFTNYVFLQSVAEFTVREWAGLDARIERIALRLGGFNPVGSILECSGTVASAVSDAASRLVTVTIRIQADDRITTTGECEVRFPIDSEAR